MGKSYAEALTNPEWQKRRLQLFSRDNFTCQFCGSKDNQLELHHTEYWAGKKPWEYPDDLLITICHKCHDEENIRFKHESYLLKSLTQVGFLAMDLLALSALLNTQPQFAKNLRNKIRQYYNPKNA